MNQNASSRHFFEIQVPSRVLRNLDHGMKRCLNLLAYTPDVGIRGGVARLIALAILFEQGKCSEQRVLAESAVNDLDLFTRVPDFVKDRELLGMRYDNIVEKLKDVSLKMCPEDFGMVEASTFDQAVDATMLGNDLSINEVVLLHKNGAWHLRYTNVAWRDLKNGVGYLNPNPGLVWYNAGRTFPSALGLARLLKFAVRGRISKLFLPPWWIELYRSGLKTGGFSNLPLGNYPLIAFEHYSRNQEERVHMLRMLKELGLTTFTDVDLFVSDQYARLLDSGLSFELSVREFPEIIEEKVLKKVRLIEAQRQRQGVRDKCIHNFSGIVCRDCGGICSIGKCTQPGCTKFDFGGSTIPCVDMMKRAQIPLGTNWYYKVPWSQ